MDEKTYGRYTMSAGGKRVARYCAIDPALEAIRCTCNKVDCTRARLRPFRDHIAKLHELLSRLVTEEMGVSESSKWFGVLYGLRMAASIEDVVADTGYVEDPMVFALCEPTIDYEDAQSEMASKYVAAAAIFNFLWQAYESAVAVTAPNELVRLLKDERLGERGRRLFEARPELAAHFPGLKDLVRLTLYQCRKGELLDERLDRLTSRFGGCDFVAAAEICREFRNFLFHGEDQVPDHEDWGSAAVSHCRLHRFYTVSRLILYLLQALAWIEIGNPTNLIESHSEGEASAPRQALESLQFLSSKIRKSHHLKEPAG